MSYDDFLRWGYPKNSITITQQIPARYKFYPTFFNGTWVSDTEILFRDRVGLFFYPSSLIFIISYLLFLI